MTLICPALQGQINFENLALRAGQKRPGKMKPGKCNWGNETGQVKGWKKLGQLKFLLKIIGPTIKSRAKKAWANKVLVFIQVNTTLKYTTSEKNSINLGLFQKDPMADSDSKISRSHNTIIDKKLNWNTHINRTVDKCQKALFAT